MALAKVITPQVPRAFAVIEGADLPTAASVNLPSIPVGSTCLTYEAGPPIVPRNWYIYMPVVGWVLESLPALGGDIAGEVEVTAFPGTAEADIAAMKAKIDTIQADTALIKASAAGATPAGNNNIGDVDVATLPGTVQADIATMKADIALIKAQEQIMQVGAAVSLAVAADGTASAAVAIGVTGLVKDLLINIPNWTNVVTLSLQVKAVDGTVKYNGSTLTLARNAKYSLVVNDKVNWVDLGVIATDTITVTLSGVPGGAGGSVAIIPVYFGKAA